MLTPICKRIIVKPVEVKAGSLLLTNPKPIQFQVIAIGDEVTKVKPGHIIYLEKQFGVTIEHENEKFIVIEEGSILARID